MSDTQPASLALTKSLKGKFFLASLAMTVLFVSAYAVAITALSTSAESSRLLAEENMETMLDAQMLLQRSMMIEHQTYILLTGERAEVEKSYNKILILLDALDTLVASLGHTTSGTAILDLHQVSQIFRNTTHIIARLRSEILNPDTTPQRLSEHLRVLENFKQQQNQQIETLMITADELSSRTNYDYSQSVEELTQAAKQRQTLVLSFLLFCLVLIWLIGHSFRRNTISRLQKISQHLRKGMTETSSQSIPVHGDDEIGEMARSIEKLLDERNNLIKSQKPDEEN